MTKNIGSDRCYNTNITVEIENDVEIITKMIPYEIKYKVRQDENIQYLSLTFDRDVDVGEPYTVPIYLKVAKENQMRMLSSNDEGGTKQLVSKVNAQIDITPKKGEIVVEQWIDQPFKIFFSPSVRETVKIKMKVTGTKKNPHIAIEGIAYP